MIQSSPAHIIDSKCLPILDARLREHDDREEVRA
jgi:hypothetical protein